MKRNDKNNRKKKEESEDILGMIRKRQEQPDTDESSNSKLREFLNNLDQDDFGHDFDYSDAPIYKLGYEDGFNEAEEMWNSKMRHLRQTLKNLLTHC